MKDKIAVITAAARGIGYVVVNKLPALIARVASMGCWSFNRTFMKNLGVQAMTGTSDVTDLDPLKTAQL